MKKARIKFFHQVRADLRKEIYRLVKGFSEVSGVRHHVQITVVNNPSVGHTDSGAVGFGLFRIPDTRESTAHIYLAAGLYREYMRGGGPHRDAVRAVGHCLLHELAHYEQWRDRKPVIERGVNVRAANLYRKIDALK